MNVEQDIFWEELDHDQVNVIMEHSSTFTMFGLMIVTVSYTSKTTMTSATRHPISSTLYVALNPWTGERVLYCRKAILNKIIKVVFFTTCTHRS